MALPAILAGLLTKKVVIFVAGKGPGIALWKAVTGLLASTGLVGGVGYTMGRKKKGRRR